MHDEISIFGATVRPGQSVRLAFDRNMSRINSESGAAFVLEFSLSSQRHVYVRQANASAEKTGLELTTVRNKQAVILGVSYDLSELLRYRYGEISHPNRPHKLNFQHKVYGGRGHVLVLHWEAGAVRAIAPVAPGALTDFRPAKSFNAIVANARRVDRPDGFWFPVFGSRDEALSFTRYVGGYVRSVAPDAITRSLPSPGYGGIVGKLEIKFSWGTEEGLVLCSGNVMAGLLLEQASGPVILPVKQYTHIIHSESGTVYVLFADGSACCRSRSDGAVPAAKALYFTNSEAEAAKVYHRGGALKVTKAPVPGLVPVYVTVDYHLVGDTLHLAPNSFRYWTKVASVLAA